VAPGTQAPRDNAAKALWQVMRRNEPRSPARLCLLPKPLSCYATPRPHRQHCSAAATQPSQQKNVNVLHCNLPGEGQTRHPVAHGKFCLAEGAKCTA